MSVRLGFDIGGTFTDFFVVDEESGEMIQEKVSTTPADFSAGVAEGVAKLVRERGVDPDAIDYLAHGTTVATNAMLEGAGATTGLITTEGFRDVVAIGREKRTELYDTSPTKTPSFAERRHRVGVRERIAADGTVVEPLDEDDLTAAIDELVDAGVESIAVALLHAYRNPVHERRIAEVVRERTGLPVSTSAEVMPEIKEYERTLSTLINAYVEPVLEAYIGRLESRLTDLGIDRTLHLMQANGGIVTPENVAGRSLHLINSGPAAGVIGAKRFAELSGITDVITLDVGGTSADTCVIRDGEIETTTEGEIDDIPLQFPQIDVRTVGAGGGSIAWTDRAGVLKVGPKSAGADPGPACYGRGGTEPTVTDAAAVLGYLNPDYFLGGEMDLDAAAARSVVAELADEHGLDPVELADGILDIAATNMAQTVRLVTVEKGYDPRTFALACYGGAGPLFATRLARKLGVGRALVPAVPGVLSASGLLNADRRFDFSQSRTLELAAGNVDAIDDTYGTLRERARTVLEGEFDAQRSVDLRYLGQTFHVNVPVPEGPVTEATLGTVRDRFDATYESIYGQTWPEKPLEAVTWRLRVTEPTDDLVVSGAAEGVDDAAARKSTREAYVDGAFREHAVFDRYALAAGATFDGPAIVEERESTTLIDPDSSVRVDEVGNLLVDLHGRE